MIKENVSWFYRIFATRKYVDFWNIPHILIGIIFGFIFFYFRLSLIFALILTIVFAIAWEVYEHYYGTQETIQNQIFDIISNVLGLLLFYLLVLKYNPTLTDFIITIIIFIVLSLLGRYAESKLI